MSRTLTVISAGLSSPSSTRRLADRLAATTTALAADGDADVRVNVIDVRDHVHAIGDALLAGFPSPELAAVIDQVTTADAVIAVSPTFQGSYSGLFKSFIDLIEPGALRGMPVLLGATGGSPRHSLMIEHAMRPLFAYLGAHTVPTAVYAATTDYATAGTDDLANRITRAAGELATLVTGARVTRTAPREESFEDLLSELGAPRG